MTCAPLSAALIFAAGIIIGIGIACGLALLFDRRQRKARFAAAAAEFEERP